MRFAAPVRRELGVTTAFNFVGPLVNPAGATRQLVGVSDPAMADKMLDVLETFGSVHAMVVFGHDGLDELSTTAPSTLIESVREPGRNLPPPPTGDRASLARAEACHARRSEGRQRGPKRSAGTEVAGRRARPDARPGVLERRGAALSWRVSPTISPTASRSPSRPSRTGMPELRSIGSSPVSNAAASVDSLRVLRMNRRRLLSTGRWVPGFGQVLGLSKITWLCGVVVVASSVPT